MNMSDIITDIKMDLGIYAIALPFENTDEVLKDVIEKKTLKTFSTYQPYYEKMAFNLSNLECIRRDVLTGDGTGGAFRTYLLPDIFQNRPILFVRSVAYADTNYMAVDVYGTNNMLGSLAHQNMLANASAAIVNHMIPKITFEYRHPREIDIYNAMNSNVLIFEIAFEHDKSLATIPETCRESFLELARLDIKKFLYATLRHYDQIDTAFGTINLKIDDWANADSDRKELISQWASTYHIDVAPFEYG